MFVLILTLGCAETNNAEVNGDSGNAANSIEMIPGSGNTDTAASYDDSGCSSAFEVSDFSGNTYTVPAVLEAEISPLSPNGSVDSGLQDLFLVSLAARCAPVTVDSLPFVLEGLESTEGVDGFISGDSEVRFSNNGLQTKIQYGDNFDNTAELAVVEGVHIIWNVDFGESVVVYPGEGLNLYLSATFGSNGGQPNTSDTFHGVLANNQSWFSGDETAYPSTIIGDSVVGHALTYNP